MARPGGALRGVQDVTALLRGVTGRVVMSRTAPMTSGEPQAGTPMSTPPNRAVESMNNDIRQVCPSH
ncbi:hypothetical protein M422DRAFT_33146 [Sphaerobolus stellatus SS14]|uniref:Uncharacterized protein n=1 Tax=Sphaerobolus stellatus (strain SS14) TaxID=990650 RepID=A0A0C9VM37_SPHS4|nr:hypothetical protein M422DRAFT_33146 [Sphaerobolus stellatus SS14]